MDIMNLGKNAQSSAYRKWLDQLYEQGTSELWDEFCIRLGVIKNIDPHLYEEVIRSYVRGKSIRNYTNHPDAYLDPRKRYAGVEGITGNITPLIPNGVYYSGNIFHWLALHGINTRTQVWRLLKDFSHPERYDEAMEDTLNVSQPHDPLNNQTPQEILKILSHTK